MRSSLQFDFTGGVCSANDNRILLCFSKQEKQRCYKSRSPTPDYWWHYTLTRESNFEHNLTAVALSSYSLSGFFNFSIVVPKLIKYLKTIISSLWAVLNMQKRSSSAFQPGDGKTLYRISTTRKYIHLQPFSFDMISTLLEVEQKTKFCQQ